MIKDERDINGRALARIRNEELALAERLEREARPRGYRVDAELSGQDNRPSRPVLGIRA